MCPVMCVHGHPHRANSTLRATHPVLPFFFLVRVELRVTRGRKGNGREGGGEIAYDANEMLYIPTNYNYGRKKKTVFLMREDHPPHSQTWLDRSEKKKLFERKKSATSHFA